MKKREIKWPGLGTIYNKSERNVVVKILRDCMEKQEGIDVRYTGAEFEKKFANMVGAREAIAVNSCGTALDVASMVLRLGPGDEVITTPLTFICTATTVLLQGAKVRFADIDPVTWNIDPRSIEACITNNTRAIYPVHYTGLVCDMARILEIAHKHNFAVVSDAAHALGATYNGQPIGGMDDITAFSFQSQKNITTLGEGGMLTTNNFDYAKASREIRSFGFDYSRGTVVRLGTNLRMTKLQAAVGITQLDKIEIQNARRLAIARHFNQALKEVEEIQTPFLPDKDKHPVHLYSVFLDTKKCGISRNDYRKILLEEYGIETRTNYDPVYDHDVMRNMGYNGSNTPIADRICRGIINLPIHPLHTDEDVEYIVNGVKEALANARSSSRVSYSTEKR